MNTSSFFFLEKSKTTQKWMSLIDPTTRLKDLVIPGTHNSNTQCFKENKVESLYGMCQDLTVYEQLCLGCRYIFYIFRYNYLLIIKDI